MISFRRNSRSFSCAFAADTVGSCRNRVVCSRIRRFVIRTLSTRAAVSWYDARASCSWWRDRLYAEYESAPIARIIIASHTKFGIRGIFHDDTRDPAHADEALRAE